MIIEGCECCGSDEEGGYLEFEEGEYFMCKRCLERSREKKIMKLSELKKLIKEEEMIKRVIRKR